MDSAENDSPRSMTHRKSVVFPEDSSKPSTQPRPSMGRNLYWFTGVPETYELPASNKKALQLQARGISENDQGENILKTGALITGFLEVTTSHGVSHIYHAKGIIKKVIWIILALASLALLILHLWYMVNGYISYDVITNIQIVEERAMDFPAVTVCNNNGIKVSTSPPWLTARINNRRTGVLNGSDSTMSNTKTYRQISEEVALLNSTRKQQLGYSQKDLIIYCTFNSENCLRDFWWHYDSTYGNCYTFNSGKSDDIEQSNLAGPSHGLTLTMNIGAYEYLPFLTEDAGIRVVIHDQKAMPFPDRDGVSVTPGQISNIAVKRLVTTRLDKKYGNCTKSTLNEENMYFAPYNFSYTQWACLSTCYQKELVRVCGCYDPQLPYDPDSAVFVNVTGSSDPAPCKLDNSTNKACSTGISNDFADRTLKCEVCVQLCEETTFESSLSTSLYPAVSYIGDFISTLNTTHSSLISTLTDEYGKDELSIAVRANFLKMNIFYQSMTYTSYTEVPSYDDFQFVSDLGGAYGLWIGWSVLTFFELLEFAIDILVFLCYRYCGKDK